MNIDTLGIAAIPVITVICFLVAEAVKATPLDNKWLPIICGGFGAVLGVVAMFVMSDFPGKDYLTAIAIGIVSGLAATGVHQIYKQLSSGGETAPSSGPTYGGEVSDPDEYSGQH